MREVVFFQMSGGTNHHCFHSEFNWEQKSEPNKSKASYMPYAVHCHDYVKLIIICLKNLSLLYHRVIIQI